MWRKGQPTLKSCKNQLLQCSEAKGCDQFNNVNENENDRLIHLPNDVLMSIMSRLTMKEAARTSVLSYTWRYLWRFLPVLIFEADPSTIESNRLLLPQKRSGFAGWVNGVLGAHLGRDIDELRVIFDLDVKFESDIDKWLSIAFSKHVKHLELDFTPFCNRSISLIDCYTWPLECRMSSLSQQGYMASLRSLCLKYVNISENDIECLLRACYVLEDLCIVNGSIYFTYINLPDLSLQLKHLKVLDCPRLSCINIWAPKLVSFTHRGLPIKLHLRDSLLLSDVSISNGEFQGEIVNYFHSSLSMFSNVKFISWDLLLNARIRDNLVKVNMGIINPPCMMNLKHMELRVTGRGNESLLGWADFIEASPFLEKLTLKFSVSYSRRTDYGRDIVKRKGRPLKSLKTLEHFGYLGLPMDIEFATYVVENAMMLKDVTFFPCFFLPEEITNAMERRIMEFKKTLPERVVSKFSPI